MTLWLEDVTRHPPHHDLICPPPLLGQGIPTVQHTNILVTTSFTSLLIFTPWEKDFRLLVTHGYLVLS